MSHPTGTLAGSRRFWVVVSLFALANLAAWIAYDRFVRPRADVLRIEHFSPGESATLGPATTLAWQFNLEMRDTIDQGTPGAFSPVIAGKWRWDDSRTLTFTPAGNLPKATRVSVTLSPEHLRSAQGFQLAKPFVSTLQTTPLSLISVTQIGFEGDDRAILEMQFSDNVLASDVMKSLSIFGPDAKPLRCELYGQAEGSIVRVVTESIPMLRQASGALSLNVRLAAGLSGTSGPLGLTQMVERSLPISEALFATELNANTPARGDVSLRLRFNGDITPDILHPMLSIEPKIPFQLNPEYHGVQLVGAFQPATRYAITIAKPSASSDPQKYPRGDTLSVFVPDFPPSLWFEHDAGYLGSRGNRTLLAHAINISDIRVSITRVYDNNLVAWRNTGNRFSETLQTDDFAHPIATNKLHLSTKKNQTHDLQIALDDLLPADAAKDGVYRIQIAADDPKKSLPSETDEDNDEDAGQNSASAVVTLSDIGLSAKRTREGLTVWALSLASAKPLAGVRVRAFSDKNQLLGSATTNADGLATIAPIDPASGENCAVVIADRASSDLTWLDLRSSQLNFGNADTTGQPYLQKGHEAFVYTDRGVYRPGETVHLRTIVRGPDNSTPPPFPIRWNILRPDLRNWNSTVTKLDADGNASWDLPLPDDLTTGRWTARVSLPGESEIFGSVTFQVEEFIPDRLKATVKLGHADQTDSPPRLRLADKTIAATIQGDWLFGKPAAGLQTHVVARLDPIPFAPPSWNGWTFGDTADTASVLNEAKPLGHRNEIDTDLLDDHGTAHAPLDLIAMLADTSGQPLHTQSHRSKKTEPIAPTTQSSSPTYPGPWKLTVSASVLEPGGRGVTSNCQADIDVVDRYIAIQSPDLPPKPGETTPIPVALVAPDGSSSNSDATLDAALYRESWNTTLVYKDGHYHYDSSRKLDPVGKPIRATITKGRGEISISPPTSGAYVLRVCDGHNGAITSISFVATFGGWDDNISREDPEKLDLSLLPAPPLSDALRATQPALLAKLRPLILPAMVATTQPTNARKTVSDEFPTDSVAQVLVRSPFAGRLLLSVETDDVISTQVIDMPRSQLLVPIAITGECRPNAYVTATVVRPIDPNAAWRVHRAVGVTRLKIDNTDRRLNIAITAPPEVRPNESLDVRLRITDSTAKPVANAAIQVAAVDEGICQLTNFVTPDPFNFFFTMRALGVTSADLYSDLMPEVARPDKTSAIGGDAGNENEDRHRTPISAKRVRPVALVSGILHTDQNGFAQTSFPLPQFVGKLRVMAVSDAGAKFGCADSDVLVRSPLLVQSSWPRFVAPGDSFSVTLTAFNNTSTIGLTKIAVQILDDSSKLSFDSNGQKQIQLSPITIAANGQSTQTLHLLAGKSAGVAHARVIATLGSETFSETVEIPIRPASPTITTGGFAIATPDSPLPISLPKDMLPGTLSYQLRVTQRPALQLPQGLDYLERYPYGCCEQTTSTLLPLVYLNDIGQQIAPGVFTKERVDEKIRAGVVHLLGMQTADGGISMWPGERKPWPWASVYVAHFIVAAQAAGHPIPEDFRTHLLSYVRALLNHSSDEPGELETQAYATYVLALAGKPDRAAMDRLGDILSKPKADCPEARFHLAAAWVATGRRDRAANLIPTTLPPMKTSRQLTGNLASGVRERAIILSTLLTIDPDRADLPALAQQLADAGKSGQWRSTQDTAFAVMALGQYLRQQKTATPYDSAQLRTGDLQLASADAGKILEWNAPTTQPPAINPDSNLSPTPPPGLPLQWQADRTKLQLQITGPTNAKAYVSWLATGVPTTAPADTDSGLKIRRKFLNEQGKPINHNTVHSGDLVQVELSLESAASLENIVIEDLLPAGLEIENPRLETTAKETTVQTPSDTPIFQIARVDMRDDRMIVIGDLSPGPNNYTAKYTYTARAITPGTFALPPTRAECMYDLSTNSLSGAGTFTVIGNQELPIANTGQE